MVDWRNIKHFKPAEFDSGDLPGSGYRMDTEFVHKLDHLREFVKRPLIITSGFRTPEHNESEGGEKNSAHLRGKAADIFCRESYFRARLISEAWALGIFRIGIASNFIHLDVDETLPTPRIWTY